MLPRVGVVGRENLGYWTPVPWVGDGQWRGQALPLPLSGCLGPLSMDRRNFVPSRMHFQATWPGPHFGYALWNYFFNMCIQLLLRVFFSVCFLELDIGLCKGEMACHLQFSLQVFRKGKMEWNLDILESG